MRQSIFVQPEDSNFKRLDRVERIRIPSPPRLRDHPSARPPAIMPTERELQISPIVQESVIHNTKVRPTVAVASSR